MSKSEVLSGSALLAQMDEADDIVKVTYKNDDLRYDLGNLAAFDTHPINEAEYRVDREKYLLTAATANFQLMLKHIFEFPIEKTELGPVVCRRRHSNRLFINIRIIVTAHFFFPNWGIGGESSNILCKYIVKSVILHLFATILVNPRPIRP